MVYTQLAWYKNKNMHIVYKSIGKLTLQSVQRPLEGHPKGREPSSLDHVNDQESSSPCSRTGVLIPAHKRTNKPESWTPKGLASMDLGTQDLVTQIKGVLNFSRGLARCKSRLEWEEFEAPLEACLERSPRNEEQVLVLSKKATDFKGHQSRTNTSITWSMPTTRTYPTREGVIKSINKVWFLARLTSVHTMRRAMNNQRPRRLRKINTKDSAKRNRSDTQDLPAGQEHEKNFS